jgi:hypothetical protein
MSGVCVTFFHLNYAILIPCGHCWNTLQHCKPRALLEQFVGVVRTGTIVGSHCSQRDLGSHFDKALGYHCCISYTVANAFLFLQCHQLRPQVDIYH